ncbi:hypothetical protein BDY19DRAFT_907556 [Irpex rosettiformis]|uniref:Uncharacterized protein n=1 Tax=Irpex rosettiformis TaxID=378272 RepID=A0ACB8TZD5_9APHY|nr:hypothetical protein BDY19DRAFT_907556 [Irpex rosettiformis]
MARTDKLASTSIAVDIDEPKTGDVVVLQIDPVESVAHLQDEKATKRMLGIQPKKYIGIVDKVRSTTPGQSWHKCDVRIFPHPHWVTEEDENIDTCYRVTVRLRPMPTSPTSKSGVIDSVPPGFDREVEEPEVEITREDIEAMQCPLSPLEWRRLEEAVDKVNEANDPDLRAPLVLYAPVNAPWAAHVDLESGMGFPEDYLGESDRVVRELDLAINRQTLESLIVLGPRRLCVEMAQARKTHEDQSLGEASEATEEVADDDDWEKLEGALDEWVEDAPRRERPPPKAIVRNGRTLVGRRTVRQPTGEFWMSEDIVSSDSRERQSVHAVCHSTPNEQ